MYQFVTLLLSSGLLYVAVKILLAIGALGQWQKTTDKEMASHGAMLHEQTGLIQNIIGFLRGKKEGQEGKDD